LQQAAAGAVKRRGEEVAGRAEDILNRAQGLVAKASDWFECQEQVSDDVLAARVRSRLGHLTDQAHEIETGVQDGVVTLKGSLGLAKRRVLAGIWNIPGVREVHVEPATSAAV
jgi:osmotically-inducible protein OsmY